MFRLVKILNGRTNQGDPVRLPCGERNIEFGEALCLEDGEIYTCASGEVPSFISCGSMPGLPVHHKLNGHEFG